MIIMHLISNYIIIIQNKRTLYRAYANTIFMAFHLNLCIWQMLLWKASYIFSRYIFLVHTFPMIRYIFTQPGSASASLYCLLSALSSAVVCYVNAP